MLTLDRLSRLTPIDRPQALRCLEAEFEVILGRVRCTDQRHAVLYVVSHRRSRPQPPKETLLAYWRMVAAESPAVKQAAINDSGLLLAAEVSGPVEAARLRHRLSVTLGNVASPQAPWRGVVDAITMDPWRPAFETLAKFASPSPMPQTSDTEQALGLAVLADEAAPRRLRDFTRRFVARTRTTDIATDASLAVGEMVAHLAFESNPEWIRLDLRSTASATWMDVHGRCGEPGPSTAPSQACCSHQLMRRLARRAGESRTPSRHRLWCEV